LDIAELLENAKEVLWVDDDVGENGFLTRDMLRIEDSALVDSAVELDPLIIPRGKNVLDGNDGVVGRSFASNHDVGRK